MVESRFEPLVETFVEWLLHNKGRSPRTAEAYRLALERLATYATGFNRDPLQLSADELGVYGGIWLHKQGVGPRSRRPYIAGVRMFFKWAAARKEISSDPARSLVYPKIGQKIPSVMTLENMQKLMWAPDFTTFEGTRDAAILAVLAGVGLRASGVSALNQSHLLQDNVQGKARIFVRVHEKGDKQRLVPLPEEADLMVRMYLEHPTLKTIDRLIDGGDQVLFVSSRNRNVPAHDYRGEHRRMSRKGVHAVVNRYGRQAGIPEDQRHPHALRHLYGTELAESDVDQVLRMRLMGHVDPKSSAIYDHTARRRMLREADRANPLGKVNTPVSEILTQLKAARSPRGQGGKDA